MVNHRSGGEGEQTIPEEFLHSSGSRRGHHLVEF